MALPPTGHKGKEQQGGSTLFFFLPLLLFREISPLIGPVSSAVSPCTHQSGPKLVKQWFCTFFCFVFCLCWFELNLSWIFIFVITEMVLNSLTLFSYISFFTFLILNRSGENWVVQLWLRCKVCCFGRKSCWGVLQCNSRTVKLKCSIISFTTVSMFCCNHVNHNCNENITLSFRSGALLLMSEYWSICSKWYRTALNMWTHCSQVVGRSHCCWRKERALYIHDSCEELYPFQFEKNGLLCLHKGCVCEWVKLFQ